MKLLSLTIASLFAWGLGVAHSQTTSSPEDTVLRVSSWGGKSTQVQIKYLGDIFTNKTGVKVQFIDGASIDHVSKLISARGRNVPYDVVLLDGDVRAKAAQAGVLEKFPVDEVPNVRNVYEELSDPDGYAPGYVFVTALLVYNADKFAEAGIPAPTSWKDLWDPRLKGRVALPDLQNGAGRALLIQTSRLLGGDESNLDKAVEEVAKIDARAYWSTSQQGEQLFKSGDIWLTVFADGRGYALADIYKPATPVRPKEGSIAYLPTADLVKGTPHRELAVKFLNEVYGALFPLGNAVDFYYGPTNKLLQPVIAADAELAPKVIYTVEQVKQLYHPNWEKYWAAHDKAQDLWNRQITSRR